MATTKSFSQGSSEKSGCDVRRSVTTDQAVEYLCRLLGSDAEAVNALFQKHVRVSGFMSVDPLCPLSERGTLSLLGIINGMFADVPRVEHGPIESVHCVNCCNCWERGQPGQAIGDLCVRCSGTLVPGDVVGFRLVDEPTRTR